MIYKPVWIAYDADGQIVRSIVGQVVIACFPITFDFALLIQIERTCRNENFYKAIRERLGIDKHCMVALEVHEAEFGFGERVFRKHGDLRATRQNKSTAHASFFEAMLPQARNGCVGFKPRKTKTLAAQERIGANGGDSGICRKSRLAQLLAPHESVFTDRRNMRIRPKTGVDEAMTMRESGVPDRFNRAISSKTGVGEVVALLICADGDTLQSLHMVQARRDKTASVKAIGTD